VRVHGAYNSSSRMRVIYHNWSATKQRPHPHSVAEISRHSVLSGDRIQQCEHIIKICSVRMYSRQEQENGYTLCARARSPFFISIIIRARTLSTVRMLFTSVIVYFRFRRPMISRYLRHYSCTVTTYEIRKQCYKQHS